MAVAVGIAVVAVIAGLAAGYELRGSGPAGAPAPGSGSPVLSITAAGALNTAFPQIAALLANESATVQVPPAAQQYEGSLAALSAITELHGAYDIAASVDFRLIPQMLYGHAATFELTFATSPEVLTYDPTVAAFQGINGSNWADRLTAPGVILGVANASLDPNGYNEIFVLELEGLLQNGSATAIYGHFFEGAPGAYATPDPATTRVEPETEVASLLGAHEISAFITYRSYAIANHLDYVTLSSTVDLGSFSAAAMAGYARASTTIRASNGTAESVVGAPVGFSVTVPTNAPNATLGALFVELLVSPAGAPILAANGLTAISPAYAEGIDGLRSVPLLLQPMVVPIPEALADQITVP